MQSKKHFTDKVVTRFRLSERVPAHTFYCQLAELVDWTFLYEETQGLYSHTGQPSLDPVVFFKLVLVGRLENLISDRRLMEHCALRLDILYFLGCEVDEELPWHSTVSRTRQLFPATIFERLFDHVFAQCVAAGLVAGDTQAVDSAPVKANASLQSVVPKQVAGSSAPSLADPTSDSCPVPAPGSSIMAPAHQLRYLATHQATRATQAPGAQHPKARLLSNKTHYSPTDPEARISSKPGKARALNYLCRLAVDTAKGIISHVQADFADSRDSVYLSVLTQRIQQRLTANDLQVHNLLADTGYSTGSNDACLEQRGITPWIPVHGLYKPETEGFPYDPQADRFTCPAGKHVTFQKYTTDANGSWQKMYRAIYQDGKQCPRKPICVPKSQCRQITRSAYDAAYRRALTRQRSPQGQRLKRLRHSTVEPVFGSLIHHYGLRRISMRGKAGAHKAMLLAAMAYNLKKLLKHRPQQLLCMAVALPTPPPPPGNQLFLLRTGRRTLKRKLAALKQWTKRSSATATMERVDPILSTFTRAPQVLPG